MRRGHSCSRTSPPMASESLARRAPGRGVRAIEVRRPSLVVLDLALEDGSSLELLDRVRHADGLASRIDPDLPVMVLSGRVAEADRVRSFGRGADDHVCKPSCHFPRCGECPP
jgi:DNA-binding response OmpR family regulator